MSYNSNTCSYCKTFGHQKWECPILKDKNQISKKEKKWNRMLQKWGENRQSLIDLYQQGDAVHGQGFQDYMDNIDIFVDQTNQNIQEINSTIYDVLEIQSDENITHQSIIESDSWNPQFKKFTTYSTMSLTDIMKEQQAESLAKSKY